MAKSADCYSANTGSFPVVHPFSVSKFPKINADDVSLMTHTVTSMETNADLHVPLDISLYLVRLKGLFGCRLSGSLIFLSRFVPIWAFALRAHRRGISDLPSGDPFVPAPLTAIAVGNDFDFDFCHMEDSTG
jgi:hypothetical protein